MSAPPKQLSIDGVPVVRLESKFLIADVAPGIGGRTVSLIDKATGHQFLWRNQNLRLQRLPAGSEYDPNFYGGIDELLPNDIPETINAIGCPDHGELWTTPLAWKTNGERLVLEGRLPKFGLAYQREMWLHSDAPCLEFKYRISNPTAETREFMWKLHAALAIEPGDILDCPARTAQVVDLAYSRQKTVAPFPWPKLDGTPVNVIPAQDGTMDFFYLFNLAAGEIALERRAQGLKFKYTFDPSVFPYAWVFASYGGFLGHYTVVLEPCTAMPISVNEAASKRQCSRLQPGQSLETSFTIYAGPNEI